MDINDDIMNMPKGWIVSYTDGTIITEYDKYGRIITQTDAYGSEVHYKYDQLSSKYLKKETYVHQTN